MNDDAGRPAVLERLRERLDRLRRLGTAAVEPERARGATPGSDRRAVARQARSAGAPVHPSAGPTAG
jgi:hypothetical protein